MSEEHAHRFLEFAFLCDAASDKGGALDALGIGTTIIFARSLPAMHQVTLVLRFAWAGGSIMAGERELTVDVKDPSGQAIAQITGRMGFEDAVQSPHPELAVGANVILPLPLQLQQYGLHHVEITFEGDSYTPLPLKVARPT